MKRILSAVIAVSTLSLATAAYAGCSMDTDCKGDRVCSPEGRCVAPDPTPVSASPALKSKAEAPPAPVAQASVAPTPPTSVPVATESKGLSEPAAILAGRTYFWSLSLIGGVNAATDGSGASAFQLNGHYEIGNKLNPDIAVVGFADLGLPFFNGTSGLGLGTLGVGVGIGDSWRAMAGAGVTAAVADGNFNFGGSLMAHASYPLSGRVGIHVQTAATFVAGLTLLQAGVGIGFTN